MLDVKRWSATEKPDIWKFVGDYNREKTIFVRSYCAAGREFDLRGYFLPRKLGGS